MGTAEDFGQQGNELFEQGDFLGAIASYDKAIEIKPDKHEAWYSRGNALRNLGRYKEAIASYDKAIEIKPDYHEAWFGRGIALDDLGRYEEAIASYDKALEIKPNDHEAWYNRGVALENLGRYEEAIASYDKALEIKPDLHEAWNNRGSALVNLGRYEEAIASYDKALEIKPDKHEAWSNRGKTFVNLGRHEEVIVSLDKALEIKPDDHEAWNNRGSALFNLGRYEEAIASYDQALEIKPDFHEAWFNWGVCDQNRWLSFGHWLKAQQNCEQGLRRIGFAEEPERYLTIWKYYLWVCSRTKNPQQVHSLAQEAGEHFSRYVAQNPMPEWQEQQLQKRYANFRHIEVSTLAQGGELEKALELAEEHRNFRLGWLLQGQGYQPQRTSYGQAKSLLSADTAIIYWHYSPVGLTTFILKHDQSLQILPPPPVASPGISLGKTENAGILEQIQALETWIAHWKQDYINYGEIPPHQNSVKKEHPWQTEMKRSLDSPLKKSGSLKLILNIKQLIDEHLQDIKNLILIPHRDLHLLPLHTLFPFIYTTTYLPSLQIGLNLQTLSQQPTTDTLLNIHQPDGSIFVEITKQIIDKFTQVEARPLPSLSKTEFLHLLGNRHSALQFTGHGSHNPEAPEESYLELPKEKIYLTDILRHKQLDLSSYRLICLTACESGITSPNSLLDEYIGWNSAFLAQQARAVISTLWNVDIQSSAFLMIKFYQIFTTANPKISAPQALRDAQYWLSALDYEGLADWYTELAQLVDSGSDRDYLHTEAQKLHNNPKKLNSFDRPFSNPYHWAGFICTGLL